jgi:hypothetical protein
MKNYEVIRQPGGVVCRVYEGDRGAGMLPHCVYHSPTGFETGYGGSGPADLALSILADFLGVTPAQNKAILDRALTLSVQDRKHIPLRLHQLFKSDFIAGRERRLEPGQSYTIQGEKIRQWIEKNKGRTQ